MNVDIHDDSEKTPIDLFAPTVSNESFAFPISDFLPEATNAPDIGNDNIVVEPPVVVVPDSTTNILDDEDLGMSESDQLDVAVDSLFGLIRAKETIVAHGGISKADVVSLESHFPGIITDTTPLNRFSSAVSLSGYAVSCESISSRISDLIAKVIEAIKRLVSKILTGKTTAFQTVDLKNKLDGILEIANRAGTTGAGNFNLGEHFPDTAAGKKASTVNHFVRLYAVELLDEKAENVFSGFNHIVSGVAYDDLVNLAKSLHTVVSQTIADKASTVEPMNIEEYTARYTKIIRGRVRGIEQHVNIKNPKAIFRDIASTAKELERLKSDIEKLDTDSEENLNRLKEITHATRVANSYVSCADAIAVAYGKYYTLLNLVLDQTSMKIQKLRF